MHFRRRSFLSAAAVGSASLPLRSRAGWSGKPTKPIDVLIIGAGLTGLATAYGLRKTGLRTRILELQPRIGGRVRTVRYQWEGETVYADSGMEEYWDSNPAVRMMAELGLPTRADVALSSLVMQSRLHPLGRMDRTAFLTQVLEEVGMAAWRALQVRIAPMMAELSARKPSLSTLKLVEPSFADWVADQKLPSRLSEWIRISIECESGTSWDQIAAIEGLSELEIFMGEGQRSHRVLGGNQRFTDALGRVVGWRHIMVNRRVTQLERRQDTTVVHALNLVSNQHERWEARHVVCTIPLFRLFELQMDPPLSAEKRKAISSQIWGSYFKAHIFLPRPAFSHFSRDGVSLLPILSDSEVGVLYDGNPEQKTRTRVLSLLVTGAHAETFNLMPLDDVRAVLRGRLESMFPGLSSQIQGIELYRYHPRAVPAWPPGRSRFDSQSDVLRQPEHGLYLAGDFTESSHSDGAFHSAARVVRQIRDGI